jgi:hypothetical protein
METVFSDTQGAKVDFLKECRSNGYTVVLVFIGLESADLSRGRIMERVEAGGHDVPDEKSRCDSPARLTICAKHSPLSIKRSSSTTVRPISLIVLSPSSGTEGGGDERATGPRGRVPRRVTDRDSQEPCVERSRESSEDRRRTTATTCVAPASSTRATRSASATHIDLAAAKDALILAAYHD